MTPRQSLEEPMSLAACLAELGLQRTGPSGESR